MVKVPPTRGKQEILFQLSPKHLVTVLSNLSFSQAILLLDRHGTHCCLDVKGKSSAISNLSELQVLSLRPIPDYIYLHSLSLFATQLSLPEIGPRKPSS